MNTQTILENQVAARFEVWCRAHVVLLLIVGFTLLSLVISIQAALLFAQGSDIVRLQKRVTYLECTLNYSNCDPLPDPVGADA